MRFSFLQKAKRALAAVAGAGLALGASGIATAQQPANERLQPVAFYPPQCPPPPVCAPPISLPSSSAQGQPSTGAATQQPSTADQTAQAPQVNQDQNLSPERGPAVGGETFAQNMIGDFIGVPTQVIIRGPNGATRVARVPLGSRGAFKIAENESPRPQDRVFAVYNFYDNADASILGGTLPQIDFHREVVGFEKTFLDGDASIGMRLPLFQSSGDGGVVRDGWGDLSIILKYAFINDRDKGDVLSGGLVVTAPTGVSEAILPDGSDIHPTLLQPWGGFIWNWTEDLYIHGFTSVVVPTDSRDVTLFLNDVGIGYWMMRNTSDDALIRGIVPTFEAHVTTPLNHRNSDTDPIVVPDWVVLTAGTHLVFTHGSSLLLGGAVPVTGPKPFDFEAIVQFNFRF